MQGNNVGAEALHAALQASKDKLMALEGTVAELLQSAVGAPVPNVVAGDLAGAAVASTIIPSPEQVRASYLLACVHTFTGGVLQQMKNVCSLTNLDVCIPGWRSMNKGRKYS